MTDDDDLDDDDLEAFAWMHEIAKKAQKNRPKLPGPLREAVGMLHVLAYAFEHEHDQAVEFAPAIIAAAMGAVLSMEDRLR